MDLSIVMVVVIWGSLTTAPETHRIGGWDSLPQCRGQAVVERTRPNVKSATCKRQMTK
jgi:hypothetical protein